MRYTVQDGFPYYIELLGNADYRNLISSQENFALLDTISEEQETIVTLPASGTLSK